MLTAARSGASETRESVLLPVFVLSNDVIERVDHRLLVRHVSGDQAVKIRQLQHERFVLEASIGEIAECVEQTSTLRRIEEEETLFVFVDEHLLDGVEHRPGWPTVPHLGVQYLISTFRTPPKSVPLRYAFLYPISTFFLQYVSIACDVKRQKFQRILFCVEILRSLQSYERCVDAKPKSVFDWDHRCGIEN
jgi:hypothetical protein